MVGAMYDKTQMKSTWQHLFLAFITVIERQLNDALIEKIIGL
jgi:hypothetical protein